MFTPDGQKIGDSIITQSSNAPNVTITGNATVTSDLTCNNEIFTDTLIVDDDADINGQLAVGDTATFSSTSKFFGNVTLKDSGLILVNNSEEYGFIQAGSQSIDFYIGDPVASNPPLSSELVLSLTDTEAVFKKGVKLEGYLKDGTGAAGTAGQVLSSTGTGVAWVSDGGGTVTGTGTPNTLTMWSTGGTGIEDSIVKEAVDPSGGAYSTTKTLTVNGVINQINLGDSIGIGEGALTNGDSSTLGENVAIGKNALTSLTTGTNNIAIGVDTLANETTSRNNIAIGKKALELGAGNNNIGLGFKSLYASNVQDNNISIGNTNFEGTSAANLSDNVVIGVNSVKFNSLSGSFTRNVMLGSLSGNNFTTSTVSNSVFIGYSAGLSMKGTSSSDIGIGRNAFSGSNNGFISEGYNIAIGDSAQGNNQITTKYSIKIGSDGGIANNYATNISTVNTTTFATNSAIGEHSALIGGYANSTSGIASFIGAGHNNTIAAGATGGAILGGFDNDITGVGSAGMALGSNLAVAGANQVVVGRYNVSNTNTKFIVGAGFSNANRKNAFEVMNTSQIRLAQYPSNFPTTAGANDIDLLVLQPNGFVYRTPSVAFQNGATYQPSSTLTCSAGGQTNEGPNIARFTKLTWTGADGGHGITLPDAGDTSTPVMSNRLVEYLTDGTFSAARSVDFTVTSGGLINGVTSTTITGKYQSIKFWSDGTEWYVLNRQT
jgi:hypothetical protein